MHQTHTQTHAKLALAPTSPAQMKWQRSLYCVYCVYVCVLLTECDPLCANVKGCCTGRARLIHTLKSARADTAVGVATGS